MAMTDEIGEKVMTFFFFFFFFFLSIIKNLN